jgi:dihydrofolate reductase
MRKVIVFTNLSLDGVMQGPARADEDQRGGFKYGGWGAPYTAMTSVTGDTLANAGAFLFGRWTYENFYKVWANRTDNPFSKAFSDGQKYVVSTTLKEPLPWANSTLLKGDVAQAVTELKEQPGRDMLVFGSGLLVQTLMQHDLVDRYVLLVHPLVLGSGRRLFADGSTYMTLKLVDTQPKPNGVIVAIYQPANDYPVR